MSLTNTQIEVLLRPIKPSRVSHAEGQSHVEAFDIRATLTRMFGFCNWDEVALEPTVMLYEQPTATKAGKDAFKVAYRASRRLVIRDHDGNHLCSHDGSAVGEALLPDFKRGDAHDMAIKTAESQALKRAAINLGDQFGLGLYNGGRTDPVVKAIVGISTAGGTTITEVHEPDVVPEQHDASTVPDDAGEARFETPEPEQLLMDEPLPISAAQIRKMQTMFGALGVKDRDEKIGLINISIDRTVASSKELTEDEAHTVITALEAMK